MSIQVSMPYHSPTLFSAMAGQYATPISGVDRFNKCHSPLFSGEDTPSVSLTGIEFESIGARGRKVLEGMCTALNEPDSEITYTENDGIKIYTVRQADSDFTLQISISSSKLVSHTVTKKDEKFYFLINAENLEKLTKLFDNRFASVLGRNAQ